MAIDLPHTISYAILYRERIDSFNELPKEKRPPRNLWDKPFALSQFLDKIWDTKDKNKGEFIDFDEGDIE